MNKSPSKPQDEQCHAAKLRALTLGFNRHELAKRTGLLPRTVSNVLCGNNRNKRARALLNFALGAKVFDVPPLPEHRRSSVRNPSH